MPWPLCCASEAILFKKFRPGHRAGVFIWENFHPGYRDLVRKNRDLGNRASPASQMNTSINIQRKEWAGEISETEPARFIRRGASPVDRAHMKRPSSSYEPGRPGCLGFRDLASPLFSL